MPTIAESGYPDYEWINWGGFVAPAGTPPQILAKLQQEIKAVANTPQMQADYRAPRASSTSCMSPYNGDNEIVRELLSARLHMAFVAPATTLPQIKAGKLRALAVTSRERLAALPAVPTMSEAGFKDFEWTNWAGFVAPARTPPTIIDKLHREIAAVVSNPEFKSRQEVQLVQLAADKPKVFAAWIKREHARIGKLVREIGLQPQ